MRIAVVGAGIVGVTTAYELSADGHEVTVFERRDAIAAETSFANAGVVAPGYVTPWAAPGMPRKVIGQMFSAHAALRVRPSLSPRTLGWMWRFWRACGRRRYAANRQRMQRLAHYSRTRLHELTAALGLEYERTAGYLVLLREPKDLAAVQPGLELLAAGGTRFAIVDAERCYALEPGLNRDTALHAAVHLPDDEVANCRQFAMLMRTQAQEHGAVFRLQADVNRITPGSGVELAFATGSERFDAVVVCAGVESRALLRPLGVRVPLLPVHGYSVTAPLRLDPNHPDRGPLSGVMDERFKVAVSRLGNRVRVAGSAEIGHDANMMNERALATLYKVLNDWFAGAAQMAQLQVWKGARPMLPDGPPLIGASGAPGVWINLGHGSSGWALACGSARLLADRIGGRDPAIDTEGLGIERLKRWH
jgi:D-amino-acid dehydrogenase